MSVFAVDTHLEAHTCDLILVIKLWIQLSASSDKVNVY